MPLHFHAALITLLTVLLLALAMYFVGSARGKHGVKAPAATGHPDFERAFRAHQNTVEQAVMFLPSLWIASLYSNANIAAALGFAWLLARLWYLLAYIRPGGNRGPGFTISSLAGLGLLLLGLWGLLAPLFAR
ncbi:MAG: MAPEG family protein [Arenimonas sp.]